MTTSNVRALSVYFNDGTSLKFAFPVQSDEANMAARIEEARAQNSLVIEAEGRLIWIPITSIRHMEITPAPEKLPPSVIHGAKLIG